MNKYEQLIEFIINEQHDKARELFHSIVVEKSREIYESLIDEEDLAEIGGNEVESMMDEVTGEEEGMSEEEEMGSEEFGSEEDGEELDGEEEFGSEEGEEAEDGEGLEDRVMDLEGALDELKAEFDALMAGEKHEEESNPDIHGGALDAYGDEGAEELGGEEGMMEAEEDDDEEELDESEESEEDDEEENVEESKSGRKMTEAEWIREYVEKVGDIYGGKGDASEGQTVGHDGTIPVNKKSSVAGKNDMGGSAANIAKGGAEQVPTGPKGPNNAYSKGQGEIKSGNRNVPGGKAGKQEATGKSYEKTKGGEGKLAGSDGSVAINKKSEIGGKVR